ncbi:hypothetical protein CVT24_000331 [Panaeolus cyanescens]|uniref:Cyclase n=1 Tax=Panaeolus cyanescens TaxID=181874 RepID=A0A409VIV8_9AGAR|nr:hypothetical protein CVT24_000331 [Panaeolus cyanescens]
MSSNFIDLSHPLDESVQVYPGDPLMSSHPCATIAKDGYNVTGLSLGSHTGTHLDAPYHFVQDGRKIEEILLEELVGRFALVDLASDSFSEPGLSARQRITWEDHILPALHKSGVLSSDGPRPKIMLIRTAWSEHFKTPKYFHHPYLTRDAAERILEAGFRVIGVDTPSPDETPIDGVGGDEGFGFHEVILGAGSMIVENLTNLESIASAIRRTDLHDGCWIVNLAPLRLVGCDGSPIRAMDLNAELS